MKYLLKNNKTIIWFICIFCCLALVILSACSDNTQNQSSDSENSVSAYVNSLKESVSDNTSSQTESVVNTEVSDEQLFAEYINNNSEFSRVNEDICSPDDKNAKGLVGGYLCDIDSDDAPELIISRSLGGKHTELCVEIYDVYQGKVKLMQTVTNGKATYSNAYANNDVFLTEYNGERFLCSKLYHTSEASGIPSEQSLTVYKLSKDGTKKVFTMEYKESSYSNTELSVNNEVVFVSSYPSGYKYSSLGEAAEKVNKLILKYGLTDKIYEEKSGEKTVSLTFEGYSQKNDVCRIGYRREVISGSLTTLQIQYTTAFSNELN